MNKKNNRRLTAFAILSLAVIHAHSAYFAYAQEAAGGPENTSAATTRPRSVALTIQQVPGGAAQKISCADPQRCSLAVPTKLDSRSQTVTVNVSYVDGGALLTFQTPDGYLYAADKDPVDPQHPVFMTTWGTTVENGKPKTSKITLFDPPVPHPLLAKIMDRPPGKAVADLQVTAEAAP